MSRPCGDKQVDQTRGVRRYLGPCRADDARMGVRPWRIVQPIAGTGGEKRGPFGDTLTADLCMRHGRKRKPGGTLRQGFAPSLADFADGRFSRSRARATSKANFIDPQFQHGHGNSHIITGGDGLFLMPQNSPANILRTSGRAQPILSAVAQAVDRLCARRSLAGHLTRRV